MSLVRLLPSSTLRDERIFLFPFTGVWSTVLVCGADRLVVSPDGPLEAFVEPMGAVGSSGGAGDEFRLS